MQEECPCVDQAVIIGKSSLKQRESLASTRIKSHKSSNSLGTIWAHFFYIILNIYSKSHLNLGKKLKYNSSICIWNICSTYIFKIMEYGGNILQRNWHWNHELHCFTKLFIMAYLLFLWLSDSQIISIIYVCTSIFIMVLLIVFFKLYFILV